jgi:hypothetical protein
MCEIPDEGRSRPDGTRGATRVPAAVPVRQKTRDANLVHQLDRQPHQTHAALIAATLHGSAPARHARERLPFRVYGHLARSWRARRPNRQFGPFLQALFDTS